MDTLTRPTIDVRHEMLRIAGKKVETKARLEVRFPWDNRLVGSVPRATPELVAEAFKIAHAYQPRLTRYQRQQILLKTAELLVARKEELSRLITLESGLCLKDSLYEVGRAFDVFTFAGQLCLLDDGQTFSCDLTPHGKPRKIFTLRQPLNAISAITPFNHPLNMVAHKLAPAVATNNCVVLKPTELTPLTALFLADTLYEAGLPPEMLSVITGNPSDIGDAMITDPHADLVTFTGSVRVGKHIANTAGYKRLVLELGGNDPLIVMEDADLDRAAELAVAGATKNSGQRCTAVKRIIVVENVADAFVERVLAKARKLKAGDPGDPDHPRQGHRPGDKGGQRHRLWPVLRRLHRSPGLHHALRRRVAGRHGQCVGGAGLSHRDVAVRRHQGFGPGLQGGRAGSDEELHQCKDLVAALARLKSPGVIKKSCHSKSRGSDQRGSGDNCLGSTAELTIR